MTIFGGQLWDTESAADSRREKGQNEGFVHVRLRRERRGSQDAVNSFIGWVATDTSQVGNFDYA